ncbi:ATP-dependent DNA helicase [Prochlorococcus sp. MIT 1307]|uniref:ATP-dependent DNA helicase n=1 Tax=Prochlorococcus sp. MIT 1307 TaxID=3096219 RepID=UPI002A75F030|nr:AAA family ATPase [Prochlorococcus sp. MIT 1307]
MTRNNSGRVLKELTVDQKQAFDSFSAWLDGDQVDKPFVLSGYAGSGKTFLSMRFLRKVEAEGLCWTVVAPTHKAVGVLRQTLEIEGIRPTWYPSTIHRLLRLKLKRKGDIELCEQTDQTTNSLEELGLVLIDEASMVDSNLLRIVLQCAHSFSTRLVFVGDPAQLPPIGEPVSPVFSMKRASQAQLNQVVRHQGPVLQLASCLRDGRLPCDFPPCLPLIQNKKGLVACVDETSWLGRARSALRAAAEEGTPDAARILCYTNRTLERLVPHVRKAIHGEMAEQLPVLPGEVLISRTAVMAPASLDGAETGEEPDMVIGSNRELVVRDVTPESCDLAAFGLAELGDGKAPKIETLMVNVVSGALELSLRLAPPVGSNARKLLDNTLQRLRNRAKEAGKKDGRMLWRQFFLIRDAFASLGPAAVLTVHRSQGSTFEEVFVASDVFWPKDLTLRRQLVYVAVSRAKNSVWIVGSQRDNSKKTLWEDQLRTSLEN